ncbi:MAG TPA: hypothetical protein VN203_23165 [Candidatus Acidoferrum sp.]|nr:hypothetical protein [Candidatus Acidoferrum sp.]
MKKFLPILVVALSFSEVWGQGVGTVGGLTREACVVPTVTSGSAYASGNNVGGLLQLNPAWRTSAQGAPDQGGVVQSIRLNFKSGQTAPFKAYQFVTNPSNTTWTDHTTIVMATADDFSVRPPIALTTGDSGLGTMTVYGSDAVARAHVGVGTIDYWVLVTTGTPTLASVGDMQFCVTYLLD